MTGRANRIDMRLAVICLLFVSAARAEAPHVLPRPRLPSDQRLGPLKDLNGYFPFVPCKSEAEWAVRAERTRRQLLVAMGLWPMPAPTPPRAVVHGRVDRDVRPDRPSRRLDVRAAPEPDGHRRPHHGRA